MALFYRWILFPVLAVAVSTASAQTSVPHSVPKDGSKKEEQAPIERPKIVRVNFRDDEGKPMSRDKFIRHIKQKEGVELDLNKLSEDAEKLRQEYPEYMSITAKLDPVPGNKKVVGITFEFLRKRVIRSVRIVTPKSIELPKDLHKKLQSRPGAMLRGELLRKDEEIVRIAAVSLGYPRARIKTVTKKFGGTNGAVELVFHVDAGSVQATLQSVEITGNKSFSRSVLDNVISTSTNWFSSLTGGSTFNPFELQEDVKKLTEFYHSKGFADVQVKIGTDMNKSGAVRVSIKITEGRRYVVRRISIKGNKKLSRAQLLEQITIKENDGYDGKALRVSGQNIREAYGEMGYADARVQMTFQDKTGTLLVEIAEGDVQYIDRIEFVGHTSVDEKALRSYFDLNEGDVVNTKSITESIEALRKTGFFEEVRVERTPNPQRAGMGTVTVTVREAKRSSIEFGFGYGTSSGLHGEVGLNHRRSGMDFSVWAMKSEEEERLMLIFRNPRFMGTKYDLTGTGGYVRSEFKGFDKTTLMAKVMIERQVMKNLTLGIGTRIEFVGIDDVGATMPPEVHAAKGGYHMVGGLVSTLVYEKEKLDAKGDAYGGYKIRLTMLPSYSEQGAFVRGSATVVGHHTIAEDQNGRKHVITGRVTLGYASEKTPFYERLYGGGTTTYRVAQARTITPNGSALGGNALVSTGAYYSFPVWGEMFRGVAFLETIHVGQSASDLGDIRVATGIGVRANLQDTFLRSKVEAGMAFPLIQQAGDKLKPFYLMLGNYHPVYDL